jgi:hypothetical protein
VAALGEQAGWLLADDEPGSMAAARHRLFERVLGLLAGLAAQAPLVLVLEDLHWADESSHELLAFLAVRLRDIPVLVVATLRDDDLGGEARRWLADLQRRPRVTRLRVAGLAPGEVAELVAGLVPAGAGPDPVAAVVRAADGNPLYAIELAGTGAQWPPPKSWPAGPWPPPGACRHNEHVRRRRIRRGPEACPPRRRPPAGSPLGRQVRDPAAATSASSRPPCREPGRLTVRDGRPERAVREKRWK